jgi:hypothetical protein
MTTSSERYEPLFDVHPVTCATVEVFWADTTLETFGRGSSGWYWQPRRRDHAPTGPAHGPFSDELRSLP